MSAMSIETTAAALREEFAWLEDWEARYAHLIDLGRHNPALAPEERCETTRVRGCASQVWMVTGLQNGRLRVRAESDAVIVSGLIALLIRLYDNQTPDDILGFDVRRLFDEIGVSGALTQQRSNGLAAMLGRIHTDARAAAET